MVKEMSNSHRIKTRPETAAREGNDLLSANLGGQETRVSDPAISLYHQVYLQPHNPNRGEALLSIFRMLLLYTKMLILVLKRKSTFRELIRSIFSGCPTKKKQVIPMATHRGLSHPDKLPMSTSGRFKETWHHQK